MASSSRWYYYVLLLLFLLLFAALKTSQSSSSNNINHVKVSEDGDRKLGGVLFANFNMSSFHPRYPNVSKDHIPAKKSSLLVFVSITSGPHHAHLREAIRNTWILPCKVSPRCDYRFFVDTPHRLLTNELILENITHHDMVFREQCSLMKRHNDYVNYGNSPPLAGNLIHLNHELNVTEPLPDYPLRRLYKVDWKVCFLRWATSRFRYIGYHVFVEDDSFVCMENLLHQLVLVEKRTEARKKDGLPLLSFRAGVPMFDGFDDSSTIMDSQLAKIFVDFYPSSRLNCSRIAEASDSQLKEKTYYHSWGNSWMTKHCNWSAEITKDFHISIAKPSLWCNTGKWNSWKVQLGCLSKPLIMHHNRASTVLLKDEKPDRVPHLCEHMLLIDKVKEPADMQALWLYASLGTHFYDFSALFFDFDNSAWAAVLKDLIEQEKQCEKELAGKYPVDSPELPCLFDAELERRKRYLQVRNFLYPNAYEQNKALEKGTNYIEYKQSFGMEGVGLADFFDLGIVTKT